MTYLEFREKMIEYKLFSVSEAEKRFPGFDTRRLVEWQHKNYIRKLINKWYLFTEVPADELLLYRISNCLCRPSYVSLHTALAYYQLLPEGVYMQTGITTHKTTRYETPVGCFDYRNVKPALYFGYEALRYQNLPVLMAQPEKALLDLLYLTPAIKTAEDIQALRLNAIQAETALNWNRMAMYEQLFNSETLSRKIKLVKETLSVVQPA